MSAKAEISNILDKGKQRLQYSFGHAKASFLHGTLKIEVRGAHDLPDMDGIKGFRWINKNDVTDAYVEYWCYVAIS